MSPGSSSRASVTSELLPPVREETPIPMPLMPLDRRTSRLSGGSLNELSSGSSSADEAALIQAMNKDTQVRNIIKSFFIFIKHHFNFTTLAVKVIDVLSIYCFFVFSNIFSIPFLYSL